MRESSYKKLRRRRKNTNYKKHLAFLDRISRHTYPPYAWSVERNGKTYIKRIYSGSRYLKRRSNRAVRCADEVGNHSGYRKHFDYWWELD